MKASAGLYVAKNMCAYCLRKQQITEALGTDNNIFTAPQLEVLTYFQKSLYDMKCLPELNRTHSGQNLK